MFPSSLLVTIFIIAVTCRTAIAQNDTANNYFVNPVGGSGGASPDNSDNKVYTVGSDLELKWQTNFARLNLALLHGGENGSIAQTYLNTVSTITSFPWTVEIPNVFDKSLPNIFYFIVQEQKDGEGGDYFFSHSFNISEPATPSSSSAPTSSISTPTSAPDNASSAPAPTNDAAQGLSSGAKAGIGIGVAVGVIGLIVGALGLWKARRSKAGQGEVVHEKRQDFLDGQQWPGQYGQYGNGNYAAGQYGEHHGPHEVMHAQRHEMGIQNKDPQEMPPDETRYELGGAERK